MANQNLREMKTFTNFKIYKNIVVSFVIGIMFCFNSYGQITVPCPVLEDAYATDYSPDYKYGTSSWLIVGHQNDGYYYGSLVKFDLSNIPSNITVDNAYLYLERGVSGGSYTMKVLIVADSWNENTVSWNSYPPWYTAPEVTINPNSGSSTVSINVTALVKKWIENGWSNNGFNLFFNSPISVGNYTFFYAKESSGTTNDPKLEITYTPPPPDITVQNPSVTPTTVCAGGTINVSCDHYCTDGTDASPNVGYFLSTNATCTTSDTYLGDDGSTICGSDPYDGESATLTIPSNTSPGNYYIRFYGDYLNEVSETNENNNCAYVQITVLSVPGAVTISGGGTFCNNATLTASGGSGGTIYWQGTTSNGTSTTYPTTSFPVSTSGTYYFRSRNSVGCWGQQGSASVTITPNASIGSVTGTSPLCIGGTTTFTANSVVLAGGTGAWSSSNTAVATVNSSGLVTGVAAGSSNIIYTITGGCGGNVSAQQPVTINPNASIGSVTGTSPLCMDDTTTYTPSSVVLGGGTGAWSSSNSAVATVNSSGLVTGVAAGSCNIIYTITGGCGGNVSAQQPITVNSSSTNPLGASANPVTICSGNSSTLTVTGGSLGTGASWKWYSGSCGGTSVGSESSVSVSPSSTTTYYVRAEGTCNTTTCASVMVNVINMSSYISSSTDPTCRNSNGSATISVTGGTAPFTYLWDDPANTTNSIVTGLSANIYYYVTITDANNCVITDSVILYGSDILYVSITDSSNISCYGLSDGWAVVTRTRGNAPFTYLWDDPANTTDSIVTGLRANIYYHVIVTDTTNCVITDSVILSEPDILSALITDSSNISCYGFSDGSATITPSGGTTPYSFLWDDPQSTSGSTVTGLSAGLYYHVTITDAHNCTINDSVLLSEPDILIPSITDSINISCYGFADGSATITPSGGTTPYTFLWDDPQSTSDSTITGLFPSMYYHVTINDAHNCTITDSVLLSEPDILSASITDSSNITCNESFDGSAIVTPTGGTAPYIYLWNDLQNTSDSTVSGLSEGSYYHVTIADANSCMITDSVILTINVCDFPPYTENFETGTGGWYSVGENSSWEWGVPIGPTINSAASGNSAWVTNLSGDYNLNELSVVYSPIFDFTGFNEPYISMSIWYDCQYGRDGANFQYSKDNGKTWHVIGDKYDNEMEGWNWYNNDTITGLFEGFNSILYAKGWTGENNGERSDGWITATHDLPGLGGLSNVRFRFVFGSDGSIVNDGFAFDSICIGSKADIITSTNPVIEKTSKLKIYPNPFTGTTTIEFPNPGNDNYKLTVTDLTGKTVRIMDNITANQVIFNRKELPVGFYLIELRGKKRYIGKMFIEK